MLAALPVMYSGDQDTCDQVVDLVKDLIEDFVAMGKELPESLEDMPNYASKFDGKFVKL
jgi:hypothetical protein